MKSFLTTLFCAVLLSSCTMTLPVATSGKVTGSKVGTSKATVILGFFFNQDASIAKAAKAGNIEEIATVDQKITNVLGLIYTKYETIVTGE
ncbi:TRL domain-containing protein [Aureibacter tunicatorum]|uniref:TRL (tRNA-associated locus)-like protein n=1 Tax=Aureibacter tunicatorum TaxID=866807 RepID=A0AAE4BRM7_9BACT|nr:TRL domain-containing protein [Aureibacter tunicatorum]MDR6238000.1 hypothetical protein [Aureibacter tunicatorum]BDD03033.1 hypothetical protein AUTU_05160 [Aureibacter tunicatorum]